MFGHGWEDAEGTIIDSRIVKFVPVGPGFDEKDPRLNADAVMRTLHEQEQTRFASEVSNAPATPNQQQAVSGAPLSDDAALTPTYPGAMLHYFKGSGDAGERLAKLEALKAGGAITDAEYQAQRQKIIDAI
jgi:hypothetical protein